MMGRQRQDQGRLSFPRTTCCAGSMCSWRWPSLTCTRSSNPITRNPLLSWCKDRHRSLPLKSPSKPTVAIRDASQGSKDAFPLDQSFLRLLERCPRG